MAEVWNVAVTHRQMKLTARAIHAALVLYHACGDIPVITSAIKFSLCPTKGAWFECHFVFHANTPMLMLLNCPGAPCVAKSLPNGLTPPQATAIRGLLALASLSLARRCVGQSIFSIMVISISVTSMIL